MESKISSPLPRVKAELESLRRLVHWNLSPKLWALRYEIVGFCQNANVRNL